MNKKTISGVICTVIGIIGLTSSLYYGSKLSHAKSTYEGLKKHSNNNIFENMLTDSADKTFAGFSSKITILRVGSILVTALGIGLILKGRKN